MSMLVVECQLHLRLAVAKDSSYVRFQHFTTLPKATLLTEAQPEFVSRKDLLPFSNILFLKEYRKSGRIARNKFHCGTVCF